MVFIPHEAGAILPGHELDELKAAVSEFFADIDSVFPDKLIIWENWDHDRFDKPASFLCAELGYTAGAPFLTAYGYSIITENGLIKPATAANADESFTPAVEANEKGSAKKDNQYHKGVIVSILSNKNSGFVRDSGTGEDYYFNIRSFTQWIDKLETGRKVIFKTEMRLNRKRNTLRPCAVELTYIE